MSLRGTLLRNHIYTAPIRVDPPVAVQSFARGHIENRDTRTSTSQQIPKDGRTKSGFWNGRSKYLSQKDQRAMLTGDPLEIPTIRGIGVVAVGRKRCQTMVNRKLECIEYFDVFWRCKDALAGVLNTFKLVGIPVASSFGVHSKEWTASPLFACYLVMKHNYAAPALRRFSTREIVQNQILRNAGKPHLPYHWCQLKIHVETRRKHACT
ncbi:hypothetical protein FB45DRAFT_865734 [Roridomyces roridus]|uniref:Uncharacterized protein n=1 Tax=Roridomyces roridus TaxID=1738132 RepID=A0AAD7FSN3_9AGAR|nr:hypothetical protein FB45DRAFT_865734 [Roridomyces roridus]